jgi:hypothetical protein
MTMVKISILFEEKLKLLKELGFFRFPEVLGDAVRLENEKLKVFAFVARDDKFIRITKFKGNRYQSSLLTLEDLRSGGLELIESCIERINYRLNKYD